MQAAEPLNRIPLRQEAVFIRSSRRLNDIPFEQGHETNVGEGIGYYLISIKLVPVRKGYR